MPVAHHPVYNRPEFADSNVPLPTSKAPPNRTPTRSGPSLRRGKTLTRPERSVAPAPLISAPAQAVAAQSSFSTWNIFSHVITFWAPPALLASLGGMKDQLTRQAWREKVALCFIALVIGGAVGFLTVGLDRALCPVSTQIDTSRFTRVGSIPGTLGVHGWEFNITQSKNGNNVDFYALAKALPGQDITSLFKRTSSDYPACNGLSFKVASDDPCPGGDSACPLGALSPSTFQQFQITNASLRIGYAWDQVTNFANYLVVDGAVLDMSTYMKTHSSPVSDDPVDYAIRSVLQGQRTGSGKDATRLFFNRSDLKSAVPCLMQRYVVGNIDKITPGCFISNLILYAGLIVILGLVLARFAMSCIFNWFISARLVRPPKDFGRNVLSPTVLAGGANVNIDNKNGVAPWVASDNARRRQQESKGGMTLFASSDASANSSRSKLTKVSSNAPSSLTASSEAPRTMSSAAIGAELFSVCLVTCYSEGLDSLRTTLDSIANTHYSDERKLLFVVADGIVTGHGEKRSTPDICKDLLERDPRFGEPVPFSYIAVGAGAKKENMAEVWAGHYTVTGRRTPMVLVIKCGTATERKADKKPGNRGKRDSQLVLMNFFSRVTYNDRMTPLDYDLFRKISGLMGVTPDYFEACLMVDADTKVFPDSLKHLVNSLHHDSLIMGVCGETRIANKRQSWVTAIQVYEYFISHHLAKAFESVFGGVTCLPGCFSMYRLKARKAHDDDWVPLIVHPDIVREYSQSEVVTLHEKNLLLLGEDRFLTTILLRTFPNRKMMFIPQARCRTVVPDTFKVLLSQRRRWINSTIHNLMELVQVRNLCGTFCFSMQFVVFLDLLGTVALPVAIALTYSLIVNMILSPPDSFEKAIPLVLLIAVIGLPGVLILVTTGKVVYVFWMFIYLAALPIWNFILPLYSFWHFDDFSWGETRKVVGEIKGEGHGGDAGETAVAHVGMRRWEDWERSRIRKEARERRRREELERHFPGGFYGNDGEVVRAHEDDGRAQSETISMVSSNEDDKWGAQIGAYNEYNPEFPPPPSTLLRPDSMLLENAKTIDMQELEAMLDHGFDPQASSPLETPTSSYQRIPPVPPLNRYHLSDGRGLPSRETSRSSGDENNRPVSPGERSPMINPRDVETHGVTSALGAQHSSHARKRSGGAATAEDWGPLGPLGKGSPSVSAPPPSQSRRI